MQTRQQKWQITQREKGLCIKCGKPGVRKPLGEISPYCLTHWLWKREYDREREGRARRNKGAMSYQLETKKKKRK